MTRRTRRPGLTLIELLLVVAVLVTLAAVAFPTLSSFWGDVKVKAAADNVREAWADARAHAIEEARGYRFAVQPGTGKFRIAPDADNFWDGSDTSGNDSDAPPFMREGSLPNGITFDASGDLPQSGSWSTVVVFNPDGGCNADVEILLREDDDTTPIAVRVRAMTGAVTARKKSTQGQ
jgi:prepilin-type N-terminal cleavage/methylation domain-containing protein